jgi:hypothetical protein
VADNVSFPELPFEARSFILRMLALMQQAGYPPTDFTTILTRMLSDMIPNMLPAAWGGRIPPLTMPGRHQRFDAYVAGQSWPATDGMPVFIDIGCGFPPMTTAETAQKFSTWHIFGVDYFFAIQLHWLPATGYTPISYGFGANIRCFILPALSMALIEWVVLMRVLRSDMISTLQQNFILMAKAKGLPPWKVLLHHALRPSSFTLVTVLGMQIGRLIGGAVIIEIIFAMPGIGRLLVNAIYARDYLVVQGCILLITIGYVALSTVVDLLYPILDPVSERSHPTESCLIPGLSDDPRFQPRSPRPDPGIA